MLEGTQFADILYSQLVVSNNALPINRFIAKSSYVRINLTINHRILTIKRVEGFLIKKKCLVQHDL